jgi:hypothetical protein
MQPISSKNGKGRSAKNVDYDYYVVDDTVQKEEKPTFMVVEIPPEFSGGEHAMFKYLRENIKYPNIIKINSLALTLKNISLMYERGIIPRLSAGIGIG